jgi:hypothetical protein
MKEAEWYNSGMPEQEPQDQIVIVGNIYLHTGGNIRYRVDELADDATGYERGIPLGRKRVVYTQLDSGDFPIGHKWDRALEDFLGTNPEGQPIFELMEDPDAPYLHNERYLNLVGKIIGSDPLLEEHQPYRRLLDFFHSEPYILDQLAQEIFSFLPIALTPREANVLRMRYGLEGYGVVKPATLKSTAWEFDISTKKVKEIEGRAISKLQDPLYFGRIAPYFEDIEL